MVHLQKKEELSCGEMENGEQCVMIVGASMMPELSADLWDIQELVKHHTKLTMGKGQEGLSWMILFARDLRVLSIHAVTVDYMYTTVDIGKMQVQCVS